MTPSQSPALDFVVRRDDPRECKFVPAAAPDAIELKPGQVLLGIDKFAFTANNITYAVFGELMQYWSFFPATEGWGRIPVWGFAGVVRSEHEQVPSGERVFGYLPMSTHLVVEPEKVSDAGFIDGSPHRRELPGTYQQYSRVTGDPAYDSKFEDLQALLQPLFMTSFLIEDLLAENALFGAKAVVLSSASSKTALGVAFLLSRNRPEDCRVIGLTSPANAAFCSRVGYYDDVVDYGEVASLSPATPTVLVDMAGDGKVLHDVHHRLGENLKYSCIVGATHWEGERGAPEGLPGPAPEFFFAPTRLEKRRADWGPSELGKRYGDARAAFFPSVASWMGIEHRRGREAVEAAYREMLEGETRPEAGLILSLSE